MSDTDMLYMASLEKRNAELDAKVAELEDKHWNECRQIAHYEDELSKYQKEMPKIVEYIDYLRSLPANRWISVKERLPDENQKCLVYRDINADLKITTGIWHSDRKEFYGLRHGTRLEDTIAWMPLPEPPKEERE